MLVLNAQDPYMPLNLPEKIRREEWHLISHSLVKDEENPTKEASKTITHLYCRRCERFTQPIVKNDADISGDKALHWHCTLTEAQHRIGFTRQRISDGRYLPVVWQGFDYSVIPFVEDGVLKYE